MEEYRGNEILGREPVEVIDVESAHDPADSVELVYYLKTRGDLVKVACDVARDETTGPWIGAGEPTEVFKKAQADVFRIEKYGPSEGVIYVRSPLRNLDLNADLVYQFLMLTIGGPILEFVYYDQVAFLDFTLPKKLLRKFPGPGFGVKGTRKLLKVLADKPIIGTIVKPCAGLTAQEVAEKCYRAALGGVRFIKDDEKMMGPTYCPQEQKVKLVAQALRRACDETGQNTLYAPHIVARPDKIRDVCKRAIDNGATALMFNPLANGISSLSILREDPDINVPLYAHSGGRSGWSTGPRRVDDVVWAKLIRLAGGDYFQIGVMNQYNVHVASLCPPLLMRLAKVFREKMDGIKDTLIVVAGGLNARNLVDNLEAFGTDLMGLAGSNILKHSMGIGAGVEAMYQATEAWKKKIPVDKYARDHEELKVALKMG